MADRTSERGQAPASAGACELSWRHDTEVGALLLFELIGLRQTWRFRVCHKCDDYLQDCFSTAKTNRLSLESVESLPLWRKG